MNLLQPFNSVDDNMIQRIQFHLNHFVPADVYRSGVNLGVDLSKTSPGMNWTAPFQVVLSDLYFVQKTLCLHFLESQTCNLRAACPPHAATTRPVLLPPTQSAVPPPLLPPRPPFFLVPLLLLLSLPPHPPTNMVPWYMHTYSVPIRQHGSNLNWFGMDQNGSGTEIAFLDMISQAIQTIKSLLVVHPLSDFKMR